MKRNHRQNNPMFFNYLNLYTWNFRIDLFSEKDNML